MAIPFSIFLFLSSLTLSSSFAPPSPDCNPKDKNVLLQIMNHYHNATSAFSTWGPDPNCCSWPNINCDDKGRVTSVTVAYSLDVVGGIPPVIGDLPYLDSLRFYQLPNLTSIPRTITKLTRLRNLILDSNGLRGPIPNFLSKIKSLEIVDLSFNKFSGPIPSSLALLPNLFELDLFRNKLTGSIPASFGSFKTGITLQVHENLLSGPIPKSLGRANLTTLNVASNRFTGDPSFLFGKGRALNTIILRQNKFKFDFSNVELPSGLKGIDMSHNQIYGSLPKQLGQLPLSFIDVSYNKLCGPIPTGRRLRRFDPIRFGHNKCLCGAPLAPCKK